MQSQQLLPKSEVLQQEFFWGAKNGDDPAQQALKVDKGTDVSLLGATYPGPVEAHLGDALSRCTGVPTHDSGLTPLVTMFSGARVSYDIPPRIPLCQSEMTDRKSN